MKLVLLPGMDGTGVLFEPVLAELAGIDTLVLTLPNDGPQDYFSLSNYILGKLPNENYIILAESFSGGIAAQISRQQEQNLKGIIFVASFLSSPRAGIAKIMSYLPVSRLMQLTIARSLIKLFCLGGDASNKKISELKAAVNSVPKPVLQSRIKVVADFKYDGYESPVPVVCMQATKDILVPKCKVEEFKKAYHNIVFKEVDGPHFLLQAKPENASVEIINAIYILTNKA